MMTKPLTPGCRVVLNYDRMTRYESTGRCVEVRKNTVHVQLRRICDGRLRLRWFKRKRVAVCS